MAAGTLAAVVAFDHAIVIRKLLQRMLQQDALSRYHLELVLPTVDRKVCICPRRAWHAILPPQPAPERRGGAGGASRQL